MAEKHYMSAVETGEGYLQPLEMRLIKDGVQTDITYDLKAERNTFGDCTGFVGVFNDISILRKLERERVAIEKSRRLG